MRVSRGPAAVNPSILCFIKERKSSSKLKAPLPETSGGKARLECKGKPEDLPLYKNNPVDKGQD